MGIRKLIRKVVPHGLRASAAAVRRGLRDRSPSKTGPRFSRHHGDQREAFAHPVVTVVQEIKPSPFLEGKLANLTLGAARLDGVTIAPGETFAFWRLVGRPSRRGGYRVGRSIRDGVAGGDLGGGLCQLSGIVYEAGIRAGLDPVERHPHSLDLYEEQERFTPLGLDATVVWPWKDLRLLNPLPVPVRLRVAVRDLTLTAAIQAPEPVEGAAIGIERDDHDRWRDVRVTRRFAGRPDELLSADRYAKR